ncbi:N-acetylmuramoyl-L-alanine amidase family protein [Castellaniella hirudinis]|uniref:N-acetylmuramoyl-L-alanine amidase family protein n=1 Tax=Castellaniella hirudinis TaxID=1144617 RepID=UPI0039C175E5
MTSLRVAGCGLMLFVACHASAAGPLVVLDPGHGPSSPGATGVCGAREVVYNDRFAGELALALESAGWRVVLTRRPGQDIGLLDRAQLANLLSATLLLSIHHDSVQPDDLKAVRCQGRTGYETRQPVQGYALFVSAENGDYAGSLRLATLLGDQLNAMGRSPNPYHAREIPGENRRFLDARRGVYQYDGLAVLRHSRVPAVLLEIGVMTDRQDAAWLDRADARRAMVARVAAAIRQYGGQPGRR